MSKQYVLDKVKHKTISDLIINTNGQMLEVSCEPWDPFWKSIRDLIYYTKDSDYMQKVEDLKNKIKNRKTYSRYKGNRFK